MHMGPILTRGKSANLVIFDCLQKPPSHHLNQTTTTEFQFVPTLCVFACSCCQKRCAPTLADQASGERNIAQHTPRTLHAECAFCTVIIAHYTTLYTPGTLCSAHFAHCAPCILHTLHTCCTPRTQHSRHRALCTMCTLHIAPRTLHCAHYIMHTVQSAQRPLRTLHTTLCTLQTT